MATTQASRRTGKTATPPISGRTLLADVANLGELLKRLGNIPARRVRLHPTPGTATERDLLHILDHENGLCELVDGTLVEKAVGYEESEIACLLSMFLNIFVRPRKLGIVTGADATIRLFPGLVRMPDVAFASWQISRRQAAQETSSSDCSRSGCRGLEQGQHQGRNGQEAG